MAWSTPRTWSTGDTLTAALMNDNSNQLTALHTGASGIASLATGDVITASSGSQLTRQATLNVSQGGTGAASHTSGNTLVGAGTGAITSVATLGVDKGGTGAATFTDGGVLLGSGTGAITAMAALSDSEMIVGNGTTDPVAESGATLRTSIGVGTGDSPQFTAIELGHASDTTIARASAGNITVEGNAIYRAGGTDVAIADGGTGAGTAAAAFAALSPLTTRGDILYGSSGTVTGARLGVGSANQVLTSDGTDVSWAAVAGGLKVCRVYNSADQVIGTGSVTELTWNSETFDSDSFHDTGSNTGRITIPSGEGCKYVFWFNGMAQPRSSGKVEVIMRVNGSDAAWSNWDNPNDGWSISFWDVMDVSAADYVQVFINQNSGSDVTFYFNATTNSGQNSPTNFGCIKIF